MQPAEEEDPELTKAKKALEQIEAERVTLYMQTRVVGDLSASYPLLVRRELYGRKAMFPPVAGPGYETFRF